MDAKPFKEGICSQCYRKCPPENKCAKCKQRWYCSPHCQQKDWHLGHKGDCGLADLTLPSKVPEPPTRLIRETVERPVLAEKQWSKLIEGVNLGPQPEPPRGLRNLGNSCYMNSVLQGIFHGAPALLAACRDHRARCKCAIPPAGSLPPGQGCFRCDLEAMSGSCLDPRPPATSSTSGDSTDETAAVSEHELAWGDRVAICRFDPPSLNGTEGIVERLNGDNGCVDVRINNERYAVARENLELRCRAAAGPVEVARWLPRLCDEFTFGAQEDAHEYLRSMLRLVEHEELREHAEALRKRAGEAEAAEANAVLPAVNADLTASPSRIFGGLLVSQCTCTNRACTKSTFSYESFMDLSLDVTEHTDSLEDCMRFFTAPERLDKKNAKFCESCQDTVRARKQLRLYSVPSCLVLQLKRFRYGTQGKVTHPISFSSKLNVAPFLCAGAPEAGRPLWYELRAVVMHLDKAGFSTFGHYVAFVKCSRENGVKGGASSWFLLDDSQVTEVSEEDVLRQQAYLLIYARAAPPAEAPFQPALRRAASGGNSKEAAPPAEASQASASKCRGRNGSVCSFFACSDGLCTQCYVQEHGKQPPAAPAEAPVPILPPHPAPSAAGTSGDGKATKATAKAATKASTAPAPASGSGKAKKVGANDPCPCGSGSKYKKCHGKNA